VRQSWTPVCVFYLQLRPATNLLLAININTVYRVQCVGIKRFVADMKNCGNLLHMELEFVQTEPSDEFGIVQFRNNFGLYSLSSGSSLWGSVLRTIFFEDHSVAH
jgi:hypothetical protein